MSFALFPDFFFADVFDETQNSSVSDKTMNQLCNYRTPNNNNKDNNNNNKDDWPANSTNSGTEVWVGI